VLRAMGLAVACVAGFLMAGSEEVAAKGVTLTTSSVTNNTGQTANDLHVNVNGPVFNTVPNDPTAPTAPPLTFQNAVNSTDGSSTTLNFQSIAKDGSDQIADGQVVPVTWNADGNETIQSAQWTKDGNPIGKAVQSLITIQVQQSVTVANTGVISVINNTSDPLPYSGLEAFSHADPTFFDPENYIVGGAQTGKFSRLALAPQGVFMPGPTFVGTVNSSTGDISSGFGPNVSPAADFQPLDASSFYDVGFVEINGGIYALAATNAPAVATPEPGSLTVLFSAGISLACVSVRRLWRRSRSRATVAS
jgi:hypothetical protein